MDSCNAMISHFCLANPLIPRNGEQYGYCCYFISMEDIDHRPAWIPQRVISLFSITAHLRRDLRASEAVTLSFSAQEIPLLHDVSLLLVIE